MPIGDSNGIGHDLILATLGHRRHAALHPTGIECSHAVGHVAALQVCEGRAVSDDVLERLDIRRVHGGVVHVTQDSVRDRVPDLRRRIARGTQAVLPGKTEMRERPGTVQSWSGADRCWCQGNAEQHREHPEPPKPVHMPHESLLASRKTLQSETNSSSSRAELPDSGRLRFTTYL